MSEQVKRFKCVIHGMYAEDVVRSRDFDAMEQRCRELVDAVKCLGALNASIAADGLKACKDGDTLRATITAARDKLGPALRLGHHAILEQAVTDVLVLLEAAHEG